MVSRGIYTPICLGISLGLPGTSCGGRGSEVFQLVESIIAVLGMIATFEEAKVFQVGRSLRNLFAVALVFGGVTDPLALWERFRNDICDDLSRAISCIKEPPDVTDPHFDYGLFLLARILREQGTGLKEHGLPDPQGSWARWAANDTDAFPHLAVEEDYITGAELVSQLNEDQRQCFNKVVTAVMDNSAASFFLHGPGGTGKTFLYRALYYYLRSAGRTVTDLARRLREVDLFIWDEVPMQHRNAFEAVDRLLKDIRKDERLFGGIPILMGGDFAQTLPVVPKSPRICVCRLQV
ncbi:hypothetical protein EYZ11_012938 [Aspergillus tanneri]|uniref:ATP-dependent DNA helicase n=1 Tax=Aspergillus tanneri TaxID=1220188 RepID=A0A4S3J127_9EURO|nr:hypothetical protein EYZ11_012938 [Aspergillus tanneri]